MAKYKCLADECGKLFDVTCRPRGQAPISGSTCPHCGSLYVEWLNYSEWE